MVAESLHRDHPELVYLRQCKKLKKRIIQNIEDLHFLIQCRDSVVVPRFLKISTKVFGNSDKRILEIAQQKRLRSFIRSKRGYLDKLNKNIYNVYFLMVAEFKKHEYSSALFDFEVTVLHKHLESDHHKIVRRHQRKLQCVQKLKINKLHERYKTKYQFYINQSSMSMSDSQKDVLQWGTKFALPQSLGNSEHFIPEMENLINKVKFEKDTFRHKICRTIEQQKNNIESKRYKYGREELYRLRNNPDIVLVSADKSDQIVILDKSDYVQKVLESIQDVKFKVKTLDPNERIKKDLADLKNHSKLPDEVKKKCFPPVGSFTPILFGRVKIHKQNTPIRPIVNKTSAPTYNLEKSLFQYLSKYVPRSKYSIRNSLEAIGILKDFRDFTQDFRLVSLDIVSLFPSTPVDSALDIIYEKLKKTDLDSAVVDSVLKALRFTQNNTFFVFEDVIYRQTSGAPMGSALSSLFAEVILEDIELQLFSSTHIKQPMMYMRYVDDILMLWNHSYSDLEEFVDFYTSRYPTIKITKEFEENSEIPYLDIMIKRNLHSFDMSVYRKTTYLPSVIPFKSHHPWSHKMSSFRSLIGRAFTHCNSDSSFKAEISYIKTIAKDYGYNRFIIDSLIQKIKSNITSDYRVTMNPSAHGNSEKKYIGAMSYNETITGIVKKELGKYNLDVGQRVRNNKQILLNRGNIISHKKRAGVYRIPIMDSVSGGVVSAYIGSTRRNLGVRLKEHASNWSKKEEKTCMVKYCKEHCSYPDFRNSEIIVQHNTADKILMAESVLIRKHIDTVCNDSLPIEIPSEWNHLIHREVIRSKKKCGIATDQDQHGG